MIIECQICGKKIDTENYLKPENIGYVCSECSKYCLTKCRLLVISCPSWHSGECLQCEHNPYNKHKDKFKHNGKRWVKND